MEENNENTNKFIENTIFAQYMKTFNKNFDNKTHEDLTFWDSIYKEIDKPIENQVVIE